MRRILRSLVAIAALPGVVCAQAMATPQSSLDSDVQIVAPPAPTYPAIAAMFRVSAICDVRFAVNPNGDPIWIQPFCSHLAFCEAASTAVSEAKFLPARKGGKPKLRRNIVYPLDFVMVGHVAPQRGDVELLTCRGGAIS